MKRTLVTDLVQEIRPKYPDLKLPQERTTDDLVKYSKARRAYRRELLARVRERFGLKDNAAPEDDTADNTPEDDNATPE